MTEGQSFFDKAKDRAGVLEDKAMGLVGGSGGEVGDGVDGARNAADRMGGDDHGMA